MNKKKTRINLILEIILWLVSIVTIYPMLMVLLTSFKNKGEAAYMNISLPSEWHPENYITVLEKDFMRWCINFSNHRNFANVRWKIRRNR